ncbi:Uncharacterized N-acetyltransferase YvbK [Vibrio tapetis subsp. tapetis]|uniref:Uncharacterized N-acetyltransferase YvbK n=2 Tax=Vibrio tapetis TaxID=52443 RepID=A0A2N8ZLY3_9VIBR|nr:Uncharacterized N-acetyltransferase YvbK [Vibrio tapetis subsp. tapetis]
MAIHRVVKLIPHQDVPMALLLEADPSESCIQQYLSDSWCFGLFVNDSVAAVCVVKQASEHKAELFNIAVKPDYQGQGLGSELLGRALEWVVDKGITEVELGTGSFGYQLGFYQKQGFRVEAIWTDFFITHYSEPIYENGIQHKDMLRLVYRVCS